MEQGLKHKNRNNCKFHHKVFMAILLAYKLSSGGATHFYCEITLVNLTFKYSLLFCLEFKQTMLHSVYKLFFAIVSCKGNKLGFRQLTQNNNLKLA